MYPLSFLNYHQLAQIQETVARGQGVKQILPAEVLSRESHRRITLKRAWLVSHLQTYMQNRTAIKHLEREETKLRSAPLNTQPLSHCTKHSSQCCREF